MLDQRDVAVRDLSWKELTKLKEFEQEDQTSFNEYLKVCSDAQSATAAP